ncbi:RcnB family protein [Sphingomonas sp. M1-B02]|uniref:RcnB family protein n=1 Tax=Sphingomonas sp. M1-B02 TaxID=3114300 RepID=UPI0022402541|nr:RcnB family protein [Sphingomonas sp. S6-11]UZK67572.1 RcnB family protein [Sphingomonas sp. S6-11]
MVRKIWMAAAVLAGLACATPATAQRVWQDGRWVVMPQRNAPRVMLTNGNRWGPVTNGRWDGGNRAPGGWNAYRRLNRGHSLPQYWRGANFRINDYHSFGLGAPPRGYYWVRYYDDAVLADDRGQVWDTVGGIGWGGGASSSYSYSEDYSDVGAGYRQPHIQPVDPDRYYDDRPRGYDAPIPAPHPGGYPPPPPPAVHYPQPCVQSCQVTYQGGAYQGGTFYGGSAQQSSSYYSGGGYAYGGGATTTTVIINPAPVVTTTVVTEEIIEEVVTTHVRTAPRTVRRAPARKWRPKPKPKPKCCVCVCR